MIMLITDVNLRDWSDVFTRMGIDCVHSNKTVQVASARVGLKDGVHFAGVTTRMNRTVKEGQN